MSLGKVDLDDIRLLEQVCDQRRLTSLAGTENQMHIGRASRVRQSVGVPAIKHDQILAQATIKCSLDLSPVYMKPIVPFPCC